MYPPLRKKSKTKIYLAIALVSILVVASAAIVYYTIASSGPAPVKVGVNVGDTFTYSIKGSAALSSLDAVIPADFYQYNETDYYKIVITDVSGTNVALNSEWHFLNGTVFNDNQNIDLSNGNKTNAYGFWAIYSSNLKVSDYLRPNGADFQVVNKTETSTYANSVRSRNFFEVANEFWDLNDPTHNTLRYDYMGVYFDKETGMLTTLYNIQSYNNPQMQLAITWTLIDSSVWTVK